VSRPTCVAASGSGSRAVALTLPSAHDASDRLLIAEELYGREREIDLLLPTVTLCYVQRFTPLWRSMHFAGTDREGARLSGVQVDQPRVMSPVARSPAVILASVLGSADPNAAAAAYPRRVNRAKEMIDDQRLSLTEISIATLAAQASFPSPSKGLL
jgi:hypothetical protein